MQTLHNQTVFVLDTHGRLHQLFHALPEMSSPQGEPVGAVFGFARDLMTLLSRHQPDYVFCAYDLPGGTFRNELYPKYKENRKEMDESLRSQIPLSRELLDDRGITPGQVMAGSDFFAFSVRSLSISLSKLSAPFRMYSRTSSSVIPSVSR